MKVSYLINGLGTGGSERSLSEMLPPLRDRGVHVHVACLYRKQEGVGGLVEAAGIPVDYLGGENTWGRMKSIRAYLKTEKPDVLHTTIVEANVLGRIASSRLPVPVLTSLVNTSYGKERYADPNVDARKLRVVQAVDGWTGRTFNDHFHAVTQGVKEASARDLGLDPAKIDVIPRGRDPKRMGLPSAERRHRVRETLGLSADAEVVLNVGRQEFQKGQTDLLDAFEAVARQRPLAQLLIVGREGNATPEIQKRMQASEHLRRAVQILGHRDDIPDLLAAADVFAFPSHFEGIGGAAIEAMAMGLPIVIADIPMADDVTEPGRNADVVPVGDARALGAAITGLLGDEERRARYGRRSRAAYEERYDLSAVVDQMASLYRRLKAEHGSGA